jgi:hypothetical protein
MGIKIEVGRWEQSRRNLEALVQIHFREKEDTMGNSQQRRTILSEF